MWSGVCCGDTRQLVVCAQSGRAPASGWSVPWRPSGVFLHRELGVLMVTQVVPDSQGGVPLPHQLTLRVGVPLPHPLTLKAVSPPTIH